MVAIDIDPKPFCYILLNFAPFLLHFAPLSHEYHHLIPYDYITNPNFLRFPMDFP